MVKPVGHVPEHEWVCAVYASWTDEGVLVPRPLRPRSDDGSWSVDGLMGWGAHILVPRRNARVETQLDVIAEASD